MVQKSSHIGCNYIGSLRGKNPAKMGNAASQNGSIDFDRATFAVVTLQID